MSSVTDSQQAFHRGTTPIFSLLIDEQTRQLAELQADPELATRLEQLADRANEGELSAEDQAEYEGYIAANNVVAVLQAEARFRLAHPNT